MDLEIRSIPATDRQRYSTRLRSYETELTRLEKDLVSQMFVCTDQWDVMSWNLVSLGIAQVLFVRSLILNVK